MEVVVEETEVSEEGEEEGEEDDEEEGEEEGEEEAEEDDEHDGAGGAAFGGEDADGEGGGGEGGEGSEGGNGGEGGESESDASVAATDVVEGEPPGVDQPTAVNEAKRQRRATRYALVETPALTAELDAFERHRAAPLLAARSSVAVTAATRKEDRACALRLLGWLDALGKLPQPASLRVFSSPKIVAVIERFVKDHCDATSAQGKPRSYKWAANHIGSFLALLRFVGTRAEVAPSVVTQLEALHKQTLQQSRVETKFTAGKAPAAWLDWPAVLQARVSAERAVTAYMLQGPRPR